MVERPVSTNLPRHHCDGGDFSRRAVTWSRRNDACDEERMIVVEFRENMDRFDDFDFLQRRRRWVKSFLESGQAPPRNMENPQGVNLNGK